MVVCVGRHEQGSYQGYGGVDRCEYLGVVNCLIGHVHGCEWKYACMHE